MVNLLHTQSKLATEGKDVILHLYFAYFLGLNNYMIIINHLSGESNLMVAAR